MSDRFTILETPLAGLKVLCRKVLADERGYLERLFCESELGSLMAGRGIKQINRTLTRKRGAVRGMHFQWPPFADAKLVTCIRGRVFDVAVDLRRGSPTFLKWHAEVLTGNEPKSVFVPDGFAHGFQTMSEDCELIYLHTAHHNADAEGGISARDQLVSINWAESITELSPRDAQHSLLQRDFTGIAV